jgi:hypothetical protein
LKYIVSLLDQSINKTRVYHFTRSSLLDAFVPGSLFQYDNNINDLSFVSNNQPSISADESMIVWVRNACGTVWNDNDLYLAQDPLSDMASCSEMSVCKIYPTPASNHITVELPGIGSTSTYLIEIYTASGQLLIQQQARGSKNRIDVSSLKSGVYFMHAADRMDAFIIED